MRSPDASVAGTCFDLSVGGVGVVTAARLEVGAPLDVELTLRGRAVRAKAEVVRDEEGLFGLRFVELDQPALLALIGYVTSAPSIRLV